MISFGRLLAGRCARSFFPPEDRSAAVGFVKSGKNSRQRRLSGTALPDQSDDFAASHRKAHLIHRMGLAARPASEQSGVPVHAGDLPDVQDFLSDRVKPLKVGTMVAGFRRPHLEDAAAAGNVRAPGLSGRKHGQVRRHIAEPGFPIRASRREPASIQRITRARNLSRNGDQRGGSSVGTMAGRAVQERLRIRVCRSLQHVANRPLLDEFSGVHHANTIGDAGKEAEIVRNVERGHIFGLSGNPGDHPGDFRFDRRVEPGRGFIQDEKPGPREQRHRDHDPLQLATG